MRSEAWVSFKDFLGEEIRIAKGFFSRREEWLAEIKRRFKFGLFLEG